MIDLSKGPRDKGQHIAVLALMEMRKAGVEYPAIFSNFIEVIAFTLANITGTDQRLAKEIMTELHRQLDEAFLDYQKTGAVH